MYVLNNRAFKIYKAKTEKSETRQSSVTEIGEFNTSVSVKKEQKLIKVSVNFAELNKRRCLLLLIIPLFP
jgi:hypothetical protein